jgi:hypothetical protein
MIPRAALNMAYAHAVNGMDSKQRRDFDDELYGFTAENLAADRELRRGFDDDSGGE